MLDNTERDDLLNIDFEVGITFFLYFYKRAYSNDLSTIEHVYFYIKSCILVVNYTIENIIILFRYYIF